MVTISQRRRHPRWRMFFAVVILSVLVRHCEPASTKRLTDSSSSSSSPTLSRSSETRSQNLGSSSDLTWQAWLLLDSQSGAHSGLESASFHRRITPKSVFIAPALPALPPCADGYRADTMGRCVKNVNIDQEAHLGFLLQRLNNRYGNRGFKPSNSQKKSSGPLQLNIPLLSALDSQSSKFDHEETGDSIKVPVVVPPRDEISFSVKKIPLQTTTHPTTIINKEEDETTVFLANPSTTSVSKDEGAPPTPVTVVPVAEFVDDANGTTFSEIVDYKIPIDLKTLLNMSNLTMGEQSTSTIQPVNITEDLDPWRNGSQLFNATEAPPMVILLSSTVASPNTIVQEVEDLDNSTSHRVDVRADNVTRNVTDKEIISASVPESLIPSKVLDVPLTVVDRIEGNETQGENSSDVGTSTVEESQEFETFYDDEEEIEDYVDSTDLPDEESSEGEILKHGEAGMAIDLKDIKRLHLENQRQQTEKPIEIDTSTFDLFDDILIHFNDSTEKGEKDEKDEKGEKDQKDEKDVKDDKDGEYEKDEKDEPSNMSNEVSIIYRRKRVVGRPG